MSGKEKKEEKGGGVGRRHFLLSVLLFLHGDNIRRRCDSHEEATISKPRSSHDGGMDPAVQTGSTGNLY